MPLMIKKLESELKESARAKKRVSDD